MSRAALRLTPRRTLGLLAFVAALGLATTASAAPLQGGAHLEGRPAADPAPAPPAPALRAPAPRPAPSPARPAARLLQNAPLRAAAAETKILGEPGAPTTFERHLLSPADRHALADAYTATATQYRRAAAQIDAAMTPANVEAHPKLRAQANEARDHADAHDAMATTVREDTAGAGGRQARLVENVAALRKAGIQVTVRRLADPGGSVVRYNLTNDGKFTYAEIEYTDEGALRHELQHLLDRANDVRTPVRRGPDADWSDGPFRKATLQAEVAANYAESKDPKQAVALTYARYPALRPELDALRKGGVEDDQVFRLVIRGNFEPIVPPKQEDAKEPGAKEPGANNAGNAKTKDARRD